MKSASRICLAWSTLGVLLGWLVAQTSEVRAVEASDWIQLKGEKPALTLDQTTFSGKPADNSAFALQGISRSDWVQSGSMATRAPNITVVIERRSIAKTVRYSVIRDLKDLAELQSIQVRYRPSYHEMATKFGPLRGVVFDVDADGLRKYCVGFHTPGNGKLIVKGFICSMDQTEASPQAVACTIDKLRFSRDEDESAANALVGVSQPKECGAILLDPNSAILPDEPDRKQNTL